MADEPPYRLPGRVDLNRTAAVLRQAANDLEAFVAPTPRPPELSPAAAGEPDRGAALAQAELALRRRRDRLFPDRLFGEPAWDMLLDLYVAHADGRRICISSACIAAAVPPTTGLRCLAILERDGLVCRIADPADSRRVYLGLTPEAERLLAQLLR